MNNRYLFVVNVDWFFCSHRLPIALKLLSRGNEVHIASHLTDKKEFLQRQGFVVHSLQISRGSTSFLSAVRTFLDILRLFKKVQPDVVHLVTIKPIILGGIAARLLTVPGMVSAIPGLGTFFLSKGVWCAALKKLVLAMYRLVFRHPRNVVIFQNLDDRAKLLQAKVVSSKQSCLIKGSGVDLQEYQCLKEPDGRVVVLMPSRILRDKGVIEYFHAADLLHERGVNVEFRLAGMIDADNPTGIPVSELEGWLSRGKVQYLGFSDDMPSLFSQCHIVCLPSYREGMPKCLLEAAACGRAVVTTDVPGCRDAIEAEVTGLLVPPRDSMALADAIQRLIDNPELRRSMSQSGRKLAEREFSIEKIVAEHLAIYDELIAAL